MPDRHVHHTDGTYCAYWVPADTDQPMELKHVCGFSGLQKLVGGYIAIVRTDFMPELTCGCLMVMLVDEEGTLKNLSQNPRASTYYPFGVGIVGDAVLIAEGLVQGEDGPEPDFFSLPPEFNNWDGPGSAIPTPKQIGD